MFLMDTGELRGVNSGFRKNKRKSKGWTFGLRRGLVWELLPTEEMRGRGACGQIQTDKPPSQSFSAKLRLYLVREGKR